MWRYFFLTLVSLALVSCGQLPDERRGKGLVVLAAVSLQDAMEDAAKEWEARGNARPLLAFAGTPQVVRLAESVASGDIVITADGGWMDRAEEAGILKGGTRADLAGNALVLIAPADALVPTEPLEPGRLSAALGGSGRIAMGDPAGVPAGRYGKAALERLGIWPSVEQSIVAVENVRSALRLVAAGEARFGIVYATDAAMDNRVKVVARFPPESHPPIRYPLALLKRSQHPDAAAFRAFLLGADGQAILRARGFAAAE